MSPLLLCAEEEVADGVIKVAKFRRHQRDASITFS